MASRDRTLLLKVVGDVDDAARALKSMEDKTSRFMGFAKKAGLVIGAAFAAEKVLDFGKNVVTAGATVSNFEQTARTVFGNVGDEAVEAAKAAQSIGLDRRTALESINYLGNLATATGATQEEALALSEQTLQLGADLGAFADVPTAEVMDAIASATRGEYDALQRYLPTASAATLQQIARTEGLIEEGEALTGAAALQAVYALAVRDGGAAIGAYSRESESLTAISGRLTARWENFQATLGQKVLPIIEKAAQWFEDKLLPAIGVIVDYVADKWPTIYDRYIRPTMEKVETLVSGVIDLLTEVWDRFGEDIIAFTRAAFEYVYGMVETAIEVLAGLIDFLVNVFQGDWSGAWNAILDVAEALVEWFIDLPGRILGLVGPIVSAVASVGADLGRGLVNGIVRAWNALDPSVSVSIPSWVPIIGGKSWSSGDLIPDIPYLASGGIITAPTLAVLGEGRHSEAVIPLDGRHLGNTYNITIEAGISDPGAVAEAVADAIALYESRNGSILQRVG